MKKFIELINKKNRNNKKLDAKSANYLILESLLDAIAVINVQGIILNVNYAMINLTHYSLQDLLNTSIYNYFNDDKASKAIATALEQGKIQDVECNIITKNNKKVITLLNAAGFPDSQGNMQGLLVCLKDLTKQKHIEEKLNKMLTEVERSNKELEQFAYTASHDLQEPVRTVKNYLQLLSRRYGDKLGEDAKEFIKFAVEGAERMERLIYNLLTFSRIATRANAFASTDSNELVTHVLNDLHQLILDKHAQVNYTQLPTIVYDENQLTQVFQNLISNALKFNTKQPDVQIKAKEKEHEWLFSIKDNGIGIDPRYFEQIFILFKRLNNQKDFEGSGIGLATCKKIIERYGGEIWVESEGEGKGATFYFTIPKEIEQ
ncbi:sensory box histidine kinase [Legionella beliardensis]|uniref:histidine kinase n=1 Tax=Legionella beliardensis TaxID=91822 RepID=A0A378I4J8_9GAMM|nr:ATP-binding protein [Legionella beliardensis]STX29670.1 sensory box histidine kinase [Legionella beliardensis]